MDITTLPPIAQQAIRTWARFCAESDYLDGAPNPAEVQDTILEVTTLCDAPINGTNMLMVLQLTLDDELGSATLVIMHYRPMPGLGHPDAIARLEVQADTMWTTIIDKHWLLDLGEGQEGDGAKGDLRVAGVVMQMRDAILERYADNSPLRGHYCNALKTLYEMLGDDNDYDLDIG